MRVVHGSYSKARGGAARAAARIFDATLRLEPDTWFIDAPTDELDRRGWSERLERRLSRWQGSAAGNFRSAAIVPGTSAARIRALAPDLIHLHWIGKGYMSIEQVATLRAPIVWTLHDMWPFSGTQHYSDGTTGFGWDSVTHWRKRLFWRRSFTVVAPSNWIADLARESCVFRHADIHVIPNPVPMEDFFPTDSASARRALGLPVGPAIVGFVSHMGPRNTLKGYSELVQAMQTVRNLLPEALLLVIGKTNQGLDASPGWISGTGWIKDDALLRSAYGACDVVVVPSRQDNAPQSVSEAAACGRPVVAFEVGGVGEMVLHEKTGLLVRRGDIAGLVAAITQALTSPVALRKWGAAARQLADDRWHPSVIGRQYLDLYNRTLDRP